RKRNKRLERLRIQSRLLEHCRVLFRPLGFLVNTGRDRTCIETCGQDKRIVRKHGPRRVGVNQRLFNIGLISPFSGSVAPSNSPQGPTQRRIASLYSLVQVCKSLSWVVVLVRVSSEEIILRRSRREPLHLMQRLPALFGLVVIEVRRSQ